MPTGVLTEQDGKAVWVGEGLPTTSEDPLEAVREAVEILRSPKGPDDPPLTGGLVGYLGYDGNLDTAITIRSAVLKGGQAHVHTGAGIVAGSVPEREFEETEHKAAALRRAIEMAAGLEEPARMPVETPAEAHP